MTFKCPAVLMCTETDQKLTLESQSHPTKNCVPAIYSVEGSKDEKAFVKFFSRNPGNKRCQSKIGLQRFEREIKLYQLLSEKNYLHFYGSDTACETPWLAMECDHPVTLNDVLSLPVDGKLLFLKDVISDICLIHELSICHRDIKFPNIVQKKDGSYLLIDFGISCLLDSEEKDITVCESKPFYKGAVPLEKQGDVFLHDRDFSLDIYQFSILAWDVLTGNDGLKKKTFSSFAESYLNCAEPLTELIEGGTLFPPEKRFGDIQIQSLLLDAISQYNGTLEPLKERQYRFYGIIRQMGRSPSSPNFVCSEPLIIGKAIKDLWAGKYVKISRISDEGTRPLLLERIDFDAQTKKIRFQYKTNVFFNGSIGTVDQPVELVPLYCYYLEKNKTCFLRWVFPDSKLGNDQGHLLSLEFCNGV